MQVIGLMSGTSMDGIDAACLNTDGADRLVRQPGVALSLAYTDSERAALRAAVAAARELTGRTARPDALARAEEIVTTRHGDAVEQLIRTHGLDRGEIALVGFHGQTVVHRPALGMTIQLGDGHALANRLGRDVVSDFRAADMAAGGQGAPLAPAYHRALALASELAFPVAVVNIGGVANVTWIAGEADILAFDTGPGNALIDDWMRIRTGRTMDRNGGCARAGRASQDEVSAFLAREYFRLEPPKSLDRDAFRDVLERLGSLSDADGAATLTAITAASIAAAIPRFPQPAATWVITGGGANNPALMDALSDFIGQRALTAEDVGWSSSFMEAEAFAYLAARSVAGLPQTFPGTTGVAVPLAGGVFCPAGSA